jgi:hypothetical protein
MPAKDIYSRKAASKMLAIHKGFPRFLPCFAENLCPFQVQSSFEVVTLLINK